MLVKMNGYTTRALCCKLWSLAFEFSFLACLAAYFLDPYTFIPRGSLILWLTFYFSFYLFLCKTGNYSSATNKYDIHPF